MKHRKRGALGLILSAAIGLGVVGGAAANSLTQPAHDVDGTRVASCVIRFDHADGKTPTMLGGSHACVGVKSVRINPDNGRLQMFLDVRDPMKWAVTAPFVLPDEQLAGVVTMGASGGTGDVEVAMHSLADGRLLDLRKASDRSVIWGRQKNLWYRSEWIAQSELKR